MADRKISELTGDTIPTQDDLIITVDGYTNKKTELGRALNTQHSDYISWDDLRFGANLITPGVANPPDWVAIGGSLGGLYILEFNQSTEEEVYCFVQMPHNWKEESIIKPHVHWINHSGATGMVRWGLEYSIASVGDGFPTPTIIYTNGDTCETQMTHQLIEFGDIDMTGHKISCMLITRLFRAAGDSLDTANDDVGLLEFDIHYQVDSIGSYQEYIK